MLTSRQTRDEALPIFYSEGKFEVVVSNFRSIPEHNADSPENDGDLLDCTYPIRHWKLIRDLGFYVNTGTFDVTNVNNEVAPTPLDLELRNVVDA